MLTNTTTAQTIYAEEARFLDQENDARIVLIVRGFALTHSFSENPTTYLVIECFCYVHTETRVNRQGDRITAQLRMPTVVRVDSALVAPRLCVAAADRWFTKEGRLQALRVLAHAIEAEGNGDRETN